MADLFDAAASREARDEALSKVDRSDWSARALTAIEALPACWTGLGEDIRERLTPIIGAPHHHNAWGAVIRAAVGRKMLVYTGELRASRAVKAHGRRQPVLTRVDNSPF